MTMSSRFLGGHRCDGGHLGDLVHDYVDDLLAPDVALRVDQHLLVCEMCRYDVEQERRLIAQLRGYTPDPARHQCLVDGLLSLADQAPPAPPHPGPSTVASGAPPQYQSARHSLAAALAAAVGCAGVALVVSTLPVRQAHQSRPAGPPSAQVHEVPRVNSASSLGVLRAARDATDAASGATETRRSGAAVIVRLP